MAENTTEVLVGGAVLAAAVGFMIYTAQATGFTRAPDSYALRASLRSIDGIGVGTDVRLAGVKVGTVTATALNPQSYFADVTISVRNDIAIPDDSTLLISSEGLLGGNFMELLPGGSLTNLEPGAEIEDTQGAVSLTTLLMKFVGGGGDTATPPPGPASE